MNNICIINENNINKISLNFKNNTFEKDNIIYNFDLINKDKISIYDLNKENNEIFYTEDSYLYFSDLENKNNFKKIFLINNNWNDQAIININELTLNRINHTDQYGKFIFDGIILLIDWNFWGIEKYNKIDNYSYIVENYKYNFDNFINISYTNIPIHIFIHICAIEDWKEIFLKLINNIKNSGLYDITEKIHLGILGNIEILSDDIFKDDKFNILYIDSRLSLYEINTINFIKYFCNKIDYEINILYIHTKGVRRAGNKKVTNSWVNMMSYFLINKYDYCLKYLSKFDCIGNNSVNLNCYNKDEICVNKEHTYHYSGNFWWSKKSYIDKLDYLHVDLSNNSINTRYKAENWILSQYPEANIGILFQDDTNTHPYHRYVFNYYKDLEIVIKKLL